MKCIENLSFDAERAFYGELDIWLRDCRIDGPADGESAFKEAESIRAESCYFNLRYPFWHCYDLDIRSSEMTSGCRAALWYSRAINMNNTKIHGPKALRESEDIRMTDCSVFSDEFGWFCSDICAVGCSINSFYCMLRSKNIRFDLVDFEGKYAFQYIENSVFENSHFFSKDAFWHADGVTLRNCTIKGEYIGWYSKNLTLENCTITGTQPFCYCENLKLINCKMYDCDLSFELSSVDADVVGHIDSVKNPLSGRIVATSIGEIIYDTEEKNCEIIIKETIKS